MLCDTLKDALMESPTVLCLGLGSPTGSRDARIQLAFLLAACHELDIVRIRPLYVLIASVKE